MRAEGEVSESFLTGVSETGMHSIFMVVQYFFMDSFVTEMKAEVKNAGAGLRQNRVCWSVVACLFVDDRVLEAESSREFQRAVDELCSVFEIEAKN